MKRRFENAGDGSYWEVAVTGSWLNVRSGRIGASGGEHDSTMFKTVAEVEAAATGRIEDKLAAGYLEVPEPTAGTFAVAELWQLAAERSETPLAEVGDGASDELVAWNALAPSADFSGWAERMVFANPLDPAAIGFGKYASRMTTEVYGCAMVCAAFSNLEFLCGWDNDDERTYLVSRTPTDGGYHRVYWFVARFAELDGSAWPSIGSFLWRDREEAMELPAVEPAHLDPIALSRRSTWLTYALAGIGLGSLEEDTQGIADVASFEAESALLGEHPHLACYWLLHHYIAGNRAMLTRAIEHSDGSSHPWVRGLRGLISRATAESPLTIGCVDAAYREEFATSAPRRAFGD